MSEIFLAFLGEENKDIREKKKKMENETFTRLVAIGRD